LASLCDRQLDASSLLAKIVRLGMRRSLMWGIITLVRAAVRAKRSVNGSVVLYGYLTGPDASGKAKGRTRS